MSTLTDRPWEILASDISIRVLEQAVTGHYAIERWLRDRISFQQVNLNAQLPKQAPFDVIFLRNIMIYFNQDTKRRIVANLAQCLKPEGFMLIGHSESLNGISAAHKAVRSAIYRKPG